MGNQIEVEGLHRLEGEAKIQGSKNAVLPILSACVLNRGETILHGCPRILDVFSMLEALECAGAAVSWEGNTLILNTADLKPVPFIEKAGRMRSSVMLLGSFLARFGRATLGYPGGCCIGKRPIDLHEQALSAMGAQLCEEETCLRAECNHLEGCDLYLPYSSVGVTENVLLAAAGAAGQTRIYGAAKEPEIEELCSFLKAMGVRVTGGGTDRITVMGGVSCRFVEYTVCADRIVAGTYLLAGACAGGEIILKNVPLQHMRSTLQCVSRLGARIRRSGQDVKLSMSCRPKAIPHLGTAPYPGFPTDLQSPLLAVLCRADGISCIEENVFENRFLIVEELQKMGADVSVERQKAVIRPVEKLHGSDLTVRELRGGAALVTAALGAEGISRVHRAEIISRGYEDLVGDFLALGAHIRA